MHLIQCLVFIEGKHRVICTRCTYRRRQTTLQKTCLKTKLFRFLQKSLSQPGPLPSLHPAPAGPPQPQCRVDIPPLVQSVQRYFQAGLAASNQKNERE